MRCRPKAGGERRARLLRECRASELAALEELTEADEELGLSY